MDDVAESPEYDLLISSKNWEKVADTHLQAGFRDGAEEGRKSVFQRGFDIGYVEGFSMGRTLGLIRGVLNILQDNSEIEVKQNDADNKKCEPLGNPLSGICQLCNAENKNESAGEPDLSEVMSFQREISYRKIQDLKHQHAELFSKFNIVIEDIKWNK